MKNGKSNQIKLNSKLNNETLNVKYFKYLIENVKCTQLLRLKVDVIGFVETLEAKVNSNWSTFSESSLTWQFQIQCETLFGQREKQKLENYHFFLIIIEWESIEF